MTASSPPEALSAARIRASSVGLGFELSDKQAEQLARYATLLQRWNRVHNLTAIGEPRAVLIHHIYDCLVIVPEVASCANQEHPLSILDVGSGAGLPGLVLAVALGGAQVTLLDRVQKKTAFLQQAKIELGLLNVEVVHSRVEAFHAQRFDVIVSRALSELADFVRMTDHLIAPEGRWLAMKGALPEREIAALPESVAVVRTVKLRVPLLDAERHLVVLRPR